MSCMPYPLPTKKKKKKRKEKKREKAFAPGLVLGTTIHVLYLLTEYLL